MGCGGGGGGGAHSVTHRGVTPNTGTCDVGTDLCSHPAIHWNFLDKVNRRCCCCYCLLLNVPAICYCIQGRICSDECTCCHTEIEVADHTFYLIQSQYTDTGSTSPSADPITLGAWQGSHRIANFQVTGMTPPRKNPHGSNGIPTLALPLLRRTP